MSKKTTVKQLLLFFLLILFNTMNAQTNEKIDTALNSHQQNLAAIAALTAVGNLEELKPALN